MLSSPRTVIMRPGSAIFDACVHRRLLDRSPMTKTLVRGVCPHDCPDTCGVITEVQDGRAVGFRGDPNHPIAKGWLCAKVRPYLDHVYHPDRLLYPLRRTGPKGGGQWQRITWEAALAEI